MSTDKLRVGIIGIGRFAFTRHVPDLRGTGNAEVVAIARRNAQALADAQTALQVEEAYTDWRELLDRSRLDAVVVSTSHDAHAAPTLAALERGLHVLVEKPMALTGEDAWAMVEAAERAQRVLMVGYNARCLGRWRAARRALEEGALGPVRQIHLAFGDDFRWVWEGQQQPAFRRKKWDAAGVPRSFLGASLKGDWRRDAAQMGGGMFADMGSHMVDLALWLAGAPPVEVVALDESAGLPVDCFVTLQARLANRTLISLSSAAGVSGTSRRRLTIFGDRGVLAADWPRGVSVGSIWLHREGKRSRIETEIADTTPAAAFVATITQDAANLAPGRDGAYAVCLTEAAYRSIAERRIVKIELGVRD